MRRAAIHGRPSSSNRIFAALQKNGNMGSLPTFAAIAYKTNANLEGKRSLCGLSVSKLQSLQRLLWYSYCKNLNLQRQKPKVWQE
jgi:hypothetical protein